MANKKILFIVCAAAALAAILVAGYFLYAKPQKYPESANPNTSISAPSREVDFSSISAEFLFSAQIPAEFKTEYLPDKRAIIIFNPSLPGNNNIDKSLLYISYFKANTFLTLSTVDITRREPLNIQGRPAILYEITKKDGIPNFSGQPLWRNTTHLALDIRATPNNPSHFYSFARRPSLSEKTFDNIINSLMLKAE